MFNLSLLTSDVYALVFAYFVENMTPNWLYFVAFAVIFTGLLVYHFQPAPTHAEPMRFDIDAVDAFAMRTTGGGQWPPGQSDCRCNPFFELMESSASTYGGTGGVSDSSDLGSMPPSPNNMDMALL